MKAVLITIAALLCLQVVPQKPEPKTDDPFTLSIDVDLVLLNFTVLDKKGHLVPGLAEDRFEIYENGQRQEIREFHPEDIPATVGLVIDNSGSMVAKRKSVINAALAFLTGSNPQDELFIVNFNDEVKLGLPVGMPFSGNYMQLRDALLMTTADGPTALYDGIAEALLHLQKGTKQKKALIVLSDGGDNVSKRSLDSVLQTAQKSSATIYTIGFYDPDDADLNPKVLRQIATVTGGECYLPRNARQLEEIWRQIAGGIRSQYTIGYIPTNRVKDGTFRTIKVTAVDANQKALEVRTRRGYIASQ